MKQEKILFFFVTIYNVLQGFMVLVKIFAPSLKWAIVLAPTWITAVFVGSILFTVEFARALNRVKH